MDLQCKLTDKMNTLFLGGVRYAREDHDGMW